MKLGDRLIELLAIDDVLRGLLESRLGESAAATAGLEPAGREARHLQVEAAPLALFAADEILRWHEIALEVQRIGMHAPVAGRGVCLTDQTAAAGLLALEAVLAGRFLRHDEER